MSLLLLIISLSFFDVCVCDCLFVFCSFAYLFVLPVFELLCVLLGLLLYPLLDEGTISGRVSSIIFNGVPGARCDGPRVTGVSVEECVLREPPFVERLSSPELPVAWWLVEELVVLR